jgi:hypothetical protein
MRDDDPAQRPNETYIEYLQRRLRAKGFNPAGTGPSGVPLVDPSITTTDENTEDFDAAIEETIEHWLEDWMSPGAAEHAHTIYVDWLRS